MHLNINIKIVSAHVIWQNMESNSRTFAGRIKISISYSVFDRCILGHPRCLLLPFSLSVTCYAHIISVNRIISQWRCRCAIRRLCRIQMTLDTLQLLSKAKYKHIVFEHIAREMQYIRVSNVSVECVCVCVNASPRDYGIPAIVATTYIYRTDIFVLVQNAHEEITRPHRRPKTE